MIPVIETKSLSEIKNFQEQKLIELIEYLKDNSPYYSKLFKRNNINSQQIKTLQDLSKIPVTTKDDIQQNNEDFYCVSSEKIIDYTATSGTLGMPVSIALTENDLQRLAYNEYLSLACAGGNKNEIYQLMATMDRRFMAGMAYFLGARKLGAGIIRVGSGIPELQWNTIHKLKPTAIIAVPSFLLKLLEYAEAHGIDFKNASVQKAICIGEPIRNKDNELNSLGKRIVQRWPIQLYSTYASTEMGAAFTECEYGVGGHHHPELVITEFLDDNNLPVKEGELGELTITTLGVEGMPLLRFKTGDICTHHTEPCKCGRTSIRIGSIVGRKQQMIKYKGTTLYPSAFYDILNSIEHIENYLVEVFSNDLGTDEIIVRVGCRYIPQNFELEIKNHLRAKLRVSPRIALSSVEEIQKLQFSEANRKPVVFIDKRKPY